jgi:glycosyltransferase involved in cell wall biosynthesis
MESGLVSVIMPVYNGERFIGQAIESVLSQSYPHWELVVVNDGSTDHTRDILTRASDGRMRVIDRANGGESAARNTALEHAKGEFLAFLDADDLYLPDHLEGTVGYLQTHADCDGVYTDGYYCDESGTLLQTLSSRRIGPYQGRVIDEVVRSSAVFGPPICVVLRHNLITKYNLRFDTNITIGPDWDFFRQYAEVAQFGYASQKTCLYRLHQTNITFRTGLRKRGLELAKCRINAIKSKSFKACSHQTREYVFYDLLVNLLRNFPERQWAVTHWPEFGELASEQQARLLRLMASKAIVRGGESNYIEEWLARSRELNPTDTRGLALDVLYTISPLICRLLLRIKMLRQSDPLTTSPFADLEKASSTYANRAVS